MIGMSGRYKLAAVNAETGEVREETPWFDNLITDAGLEHIGANGVGTYCMVGSGSAAPAVTDTTLAARVAATSGVQTASDVVATAAPWYVAQRRVYRFAVGVAAGNLTEVGIGWSTTAVFSRTLIKDGGGNPTTLTVLPSEFLDVTYEFRLYCPENDTPLSVTIGGTGYSGVIRAAYATNMGDWSPGHVLGNGMGSVTHDPVLLAYSGATLGAQTSAPTGASSSSSTGTSNFTLAAYVPGSKKRTITCTAGLNELNLAGGINALLFQPLRAGTFQMSFSPPIPKTSSQTLSLTFELSWGRRSV